MCPSSRVVVVDVALPDRELAGDVGAGALEMPGATGAVTEALLTAELTIALVLDDGRGIRRRDHHRRTRGGDRARAQHPAGCRTAHRDGERDDRRADDGPSGDARRGRHARRTPGRRTKPRIATAAIRAAAAARGCTRRASPARRARRRRRGGHAGRGRAADGLARHGRVRQCGCCRSVATPVPGCRPVADATGGFAVDVGSGPAAALRAADALTTTFTDQYRVTATVPSPGDQLVRLTMSGRRYETVVPDIGTSAGATDDHGPDHDGGPDDRPTDHDARARPRTGSALGTTRRRIADGPVTVTGGRRPGRRGRRRDRRAVVAAWRHRRR